MPSSSTHKSCEAERDSWLIRHVLFTLYPSTWIGLLLLSECEKDDLLFLGLELDAADLHFSWPHVSQRCRRTSLAFCGPSPPTQTWKLSNRLPNNFVIHHQQGCFWASGTTLCRIPDRWSSKKWLRNFLTGLQPQSYFSSRIRGCCTFSIGMPPMTKRPHPIDNGHNDTKTIM